MLSYKYMRNPSSELLRAWKLVPGHPKTGVRFIASKTTIRYLTGWKKTKENAHQC